MSSSSSSSSFKNEDYTPTIDAILKVSDLEKITVKKIRKALEGLFGIEFDLNKKEINDLILNRFYNMNDIKKNENDKIKSLQDKIDELIKENKKISIKLNTKLTNYQIKNDISNSSSTNGNKKRKTNSKSKDSNNNNKENSDDVVKEKKKATGGFSKEYKVSPELANFLGNNNDISRPELVKKLWDYIKLNNLQNPQDKREILSDDKLFPLFGEKVHMFTMNKVLSKHLFNRDEIVNGYDDIKPDINQQQHQLPPQQISQQQISQQQQQQPQQYQQNMNNTFNSNNFNPNTNYDPNYNTNLNGASSYYNNNNNNNNNGYQDFNGIP